MADDDAQTHYRGVAKMVHHVENDEQVPDGERRAADTAYTPSSERETEVLQDPERDSEALRADDVDPDQVKVVPGTGGVDDVGDVDVDPKDLHLPWQDGADDEPGAE
ncbi:hypothetical protein [Curtobacterium ammoniigenes]|uniref:hypothetical protein n=1 Tax=Curtobacterium ammoniigenes TaxID=395387 RepID=UPI000832ED9A|nr:hypothetical protein [Curtobacterium ammoniigenes]